MGPESPFRTREFVVAARRTEHSLRGDVVLEELMRVLHPPHQTMHQPLDRNLLRYGDRSATTRTGWETVGFLRASLAMMLACLGS